VSICALSPSGKKSWIIQNPEKLDVLLRPCTTGQPPPNTSSKSVYSFLGYFACKIVKTVQVHGASSTPHVEYCTVAWSPHYIKDKQLIEKIQPRFVKMIPGFRDKSYEERLRILRLNTLEERRNRADLIFLFKMYKGLSRPPFESLFQSSNHDRTKSYPNIAPEEMSRCISSRKG